MQAYYYLRAYTLAESNLNAELLCTHIDPSRANDLCWSRVLLNEFGDPEKAASYKTRQLDTIELSS